jgi:hypothetical protein
MILAASVLRADATRLNCAGGIVLEWRVGKGSLIAICIHFGRFCQPSRLLAK